MKIKQIFSALLMVFSLGVLIAGINSYSSAKFNSVNAGHIQVQSSEWVVGDNYEGWTGEVLAGNIVPGDSGVINLGRKLTTDVETKVTFNITIPQTASALEFYLVDNTGNAQNYCFNGGEPLLSGVPVVLPTDYFKNINDFELRWVYPESAEDPVSGTIYYSLTFEQVITTKTIITDVWVQHHSGTFNNVTVTINESEHTLSLSIPEIGLTLTNEHYVADPVNHIDFWIGITPNHPDIRVTNPEGDSEILV